MSFIPFTSSIFEDMVLLLVISVLFLVYIALIFYYRKHWLRIPVYEKHVEGDITISVIIPARNEEHSIGALLTSLEAQTYPRHLFEVIVVDDDSTDKTADIVRNYPSVKLISLPADRINSYKKKAIETGIAAAKNEMIVTTDADCIVPPGWLAGIASRCNKADVDFIAAPVKISTDGSVLQNFQAMDFMVLQGITGAVVSAKKMSMCNGANMAYRRQSFYDVDGFKGIDHIASGDDMLLMHKIFSKDPSRVAYLKSTEVIVETAPMYDWKSFIQQRIRWASKARKYEDKRILPVLLVVYLVNLSFATLLAASFWNISYLWAVAALLALKTLVELPFYIAVARFFRMEKTIGSFIALQPLHIFYTIVSGLFGQFGTYRWKGRNVK